MNMSQLEETGRTHFDASTSREVPIVRRAPSATQRENCCRCVLGRYAVVCLTHDGDRLIAVEILGCAVFDSVAASVAHPEVGAWWDKQAGSDDDLRRPCPNLRPR